MASIAIEVKAYGDTTWYDVSHLCVTPAVLHEGRSPDSLGTGVLESQPNTVEITFSDQDYFFSKLKLAQPGAELRIMWDDNLHYLGELQSRTPRDAARRIQTTWAGMMGRIFKPNAIKPRLYVDKTAPEIFRDMCARAGIPANRVTSDSSDIVYTILMGTGRKAITQLEAACEGFVYDKPDGTIHLELPTSRNTLLHRMGSWTDKRELIVKAPAEEFIAKPGDFTKTWGVVNKADIELWTFAAADGEKSRAKVPVGARFIANRQDKRLDLHIPVNGLLSDDATFTTSLQFKFGSELSPKFQSTSYDWRHNLSVSRSIRIRISDIQVTGNGDTVTLSCTVNGRHEPLDGLDKEVELLGDIIVRNGHSIQSDRQVFAYSYYDVESTERYGVQTREMPLTYAITLSGPIPEDFVLPPGTGESMINTARREVKAHNKPGAVYKVEHQDQELMRDRRLSWLEQVRLEEGYEGDVFVDAMETTIYQNGQIFQQVYYTPTDIFNFRRQRKPAAPRNLAGVIDDSSVALTWTMGNVEDIVAYAAQYKPSDSPHWRTWLHADERRTTTIAPLVNKQKYDFRVAAENLAGQGPYSATISATPRARILYGIGLIANSNRDYRLWRIDQLKGEATQIGGGAGRFLPYAMAYDNINHKLYVSYNAPGEIAEMGLQSGGPGGRIARLSTGEIDGLEFVGETLYALSRNTLYTVDLSDGTFTTVGNAGGPAIKELAWDPATEQMYTLDVGVTPYELKRISLANGRPSSLGVALSDSRFYLGLAVFKGRFYVTGQTLGNFQLYQLDEETGELSPRGGDGYGVEVSYMLGLTGGLEPVL